MSSDGRNLLTNSRMQCARTCLRKHFYQYELGIRKERTSQPLRFGGNFHQGLDLLAQGYPLDDVCGLIRQNYAELPYWVTSKEDVEDWNVECETCVRLLCGYHWRWQESDIEIVATEKAFDVPIINPKTGKPAKNFRLAGKIDKIAKIAGRLYVMEHKTSSDDINQNSDYWRRLRLDSQISLYMIAARAIGYPVEGVIYDVVKKPTIKPKKLSHSDCKAFFSFQRYQGEVFALDYVGGGDVVTINSRSVELEGSGKSFTIRETPEMYGSRLLADIFDRYDHYYQRQEIARTDDDLHEFYSELWQTQEMLRNCQRNNHWFRNTQACLKPYRCEFADLCFAHRDPQESLPDGFKILDFVHPELMEESRA